MTENDGGPAFPVDEVEEMGVLIRPRSSGMKLRDWYAGQAMRDGIAVLHGSGWSNFNATQIERMARNSYAIADAMLKARLKGDDHGE